jgi:zinc protease
VAAAGETFAGAPSSDFVEPSWWADTPFGVLELAGELDNGMRVIIRNNTAPGGQIQFRLVVEAGSVHEAPDALGSAHFLEHMMFNGTEQFPGNELIPVLESFGAGFGPDVNAYTSFSETVYKLTIPADSDNIDLALDVLAEWASAATITPEAVDAERGVVREEYRRSEESASGRVADITREVLFGGTNRLGRDPIGTLESINTLTADQLRAYYDRWYRPDNMTLIMVGDLGNEVTQFERIAARFAGLPADGATPPQPEQTGAIGFAEPVYDVITDPELTRSDVSVAWRIAEPSVATRADLRTEYLRRVAQTILDVRLFEATQRGDGVFLNSGLRARRVTPDLVVVVAEASAAAEDIDVAFADLLVRLEEMRQHPVSAAELDRAIERLRTPAEQAVAEAGSRQDRDIADGLVQYSLGRDRYIEPDERFEATIDVLDSIGPGDIQLFFDNLLAGEPYAFVTGPASESTVLPEPETLAATYDETIGFVVPAPADDEPLPDTLVERPEASAVVDRTTIPELSAVVVTYENGARLAFRPSQIVENRVEFQGWSRGGMFYEDADVAPILGRAGSMILSSGFESVDSVALDRILADRIVSLNAWVGRAEDTLEGEAAVADLETLFQLIHLQMTETTIDELAVRRFDEGWRPIVENPASIPEVAADLELWRLRYGDSPWFRLIPTLDDINNLDVDAQLAAWQRRFADAGDFVFVFVGDADAEAVIDLGARYIGTLPSTGVVEEPLDRDPGIPEENLVATVPAGVGDQGRLRINWESPYPFTIQAEVEARVLEVVVDARLRDLIREQLGASYAPSAAISVLSEPKPWVDTIIELNGDPDRLEEISVVIRDELARIRAGDVDQQYVDLAIDQLSEDWRFFSNPNWISFLTFALANPDRGPGEFRLRTDIARSLTIEDLARAAQVIFPESRSVEVRMVPIDG